MNVPVGNTAVSIATLAVAVDYPGEKLQYIAVYNPTKPGNPLQALSFGPKLPMESREYYITTFAAHTDGFVGIDARLVVPDNLVDRLEMDTSTDLGFYLGDYGGGYYLNWGTEELIARLSSPYWDDVQPPLTPEQAAGIKVVERVFLRQLPPHDEAERGGRGAKCRLFRLVTLMMPTSESYRTLLACPAVHTIDELDLLSTEGGRRVGKAGQYQLANNLGIGLEGHNP